MTPLETRFWAKVNKTDTCWLWTGNTDNQGYGHIRVGGKNLRTHRLVWELTAGSIPQDKYVLHSCDNPPCVNLSYLFLGTQDDNMVDMVRKHRSGKRWSSKVTEEQIREIRDSNLPQRTLGKLYGISGSSVCNIRTGFAYKFVS